LPVFFTFHVLQKRDRVKHNLVSTTSTADVYRLTSTLLPNQWCESQMVIFLFITRTVWDRYPQVVIVKLDAINAATTNDESRM